MVTHDTTSSVSQSLPDVRRLYPAENDPAEQCCECAGMAMFHEEMQETLHAAIHPAVATSNESRRHADARKAFLAAVFDAERRKIEIANLPRL
jgi:hypothetical protein